MANNKGNRLRFSKEEDEKVIGEVSKHPAVYDAKHKLYKDQNVRDNSWKEISLEVAKSVEDCKKRWKSLKDVYWKKKKETKQGTGSAARQTSKWEHMDALAFLERIETCRKTVSNVTVSGKSDFPESLEESEEEISDSQENDTEIDPTETQCDTDANLNRSVEKAHTDSGVQSKKRKTASEKILQTIQNRTKDRTQLLNKIESVLDKPSEKPHPVKLFFASMDETVMTFPVALAARAKMRVLQVITELELENGRPAPSTSRNSYVSSVYSLDNISTPSSSIEHGPYNDCVDLFSNYEMQ